MSEPQEGATFRVPLPPVSKNKRMRQFRGVTRVNPEILAWANGVRLITGGWAPPPRTPLQVEVVLEQPKGTLHRWAVDGRLGDLLDVVVGERADEWIDRLVVTKTLGEGWAEIRVAPLLLPKRLTGKRQRRKRC